MKIVFLSNFYNHHQKPLCEQWNRLCSSFLFVETSQIDEERRALGYGESMIPSYVVTYSAKTKARIEEEIMKADAVIWGDAPAKLVRKRLRQGKLVFRYAERPLKRKDTWLYYIPRFIKWHICMPNSKAVYLLAASAYAAADYKRYGFYRNRMYAWGYFPETKIYDTKVLMNGKNKTQILWCGRFLDWKHPDDAIRVAKRLKDEGYVFQMDFVGMGPMEEMLRTMTVENDVQDCVRFLGSMKPQRVREHMEKAGLYLFTSDRQEGWGAVLNEAMNAGCAVVASHAIGAVPYLLSSNKNGLVYRSGDIEELYRLVKYLLDHSAEQEQLGCAAYATVTETWSAAVAAERLLKLISFIQNGDKYPDVFYDGPCRKMNG